MHPFFYNAAFGFTSEDLIDSGSLTIGHDSWIGARAIITPSCRRIGIGAVIGAGSVVTRDVADFCVVAGNPAQIIRARFDEGTCDLIRRSRWWERPVAECVHFLEEMIRPLGVKPSLHPLLAPNNRFCTNGTDECGCR